MVPQVGISRTSSSSSSVCYQEFVIQQFHSDGCVSLSQILYEYYIDLDRSVPPGTFLFIWHLLVGVIRLSYNLHSNSFQIYYWNFIIYSSNIIFFYICIYIDIGIETLLCVIRKEYMFGIYLCYQEELLIDIY